jgi:hypothetical protein
MSTRSEPALPTQLPSRGGEDGGVVREALQGFWTDYGGHARARVRGSAHVRTHAALGSTARRDVA